MDKKQAKEALLRTRRWVEDASERRESSEALAARPDLQQFKDEREQFNAKVHEELSGIPIPAGLREQILAQAKIVRVPGWRQPAVLLAVAAALLVMTGGLFYLTRPREDLTVAGFRSRMTGFAVREYRMDVLTNSLPAVNTFLAANGGPANFKLPEPLARIPIKGGAHLTWQKKDVSMVCFDWQGSQTIYMFVLSEPLEQSGAAGAPQLKIEKSLSTATWSANGLTFLLAGKLPESTLADLVRS